MLNKVKARLFGEGGDASPDDASARDDRPDATRIGRFEITRRLGAGAMGVVFLARDLELDRRVAIKLLQPRFTGREGLERAQQRMRREARAMARLNHPNVVAVH
ncbi:MAG: protein kinase, partial [Myxococcales bacterium]|nr:protein kinase [Myxococcales bacterium]